MTEGGGYYFVI